MKKLPLLCISLAFLSGLLLAGWYSLQAWIWSVLGLVSLICSLPRVCSMFEKILPLTQGLSEYWRRHLPLPMGILLAALFFGAARYQFSIPVVTPNDLAWHNEKGVVRLEARIVNDPEDGEKITLFQADAITLYPDAAQEIPHGVRGTLVVMLPAGEDWRYGDILEMEGELSTPSEDADFSFRDYYARQGVYSQMSYPYARLIRRGASFSPLALIYSLREKTHLVINRILPMPESGLLVGILLGIDNDIPNSLAEAFRETGTAHIYVISGFNIAIIAWLFSVFSGKIIANRWGALGAAITGIVFYTFLVGAQPAVVRAAIMGASGLLAHQIGRRQHGITALVFAAAVMCMFAPNLPWSVSFQLSFAATAGLVLYGTLLQDAFLEKAQRWFSNATARRLAAPVSEYLLCTLAAQVTTLPVLAYHFQRLSLTSLLANPLILPPQPLVMILGGVAAVLGLIALPLGKIFAYLVYPLLLYTNRITELLAQISHGSVVLGEITLWEAALFYFVLFILTVQTSFLKRLRPWIKPGVVIIVLILLSTITWRAALAAPQGNLKFTLFNLTDGPSYLIQSPSGNNILIDTSKDVNSLGQALGRRLSPLRSQLDMVILPVYQRGKIDALQGIVERFPVKHVIWQTRSLEDPSSYSLLSTFRDQATIIDALETGQQVDLGGGAILHILYADPNNTALLLEWRNLRLLIPGGVSGNDLESISMDRYLTSNVLIVDEDDFHPNIDEGLGGFPALTIWTGNQNAAPSREWIQLMDFRWLALTTDGYNLWVEAK